MSNEITRQELYAQGWRWAYRGLSSGRLSEKDVERELERECHFMPYVHGLSAGLEDWREEQDAKA